MVARVPRIDPPNIDPAAPAADRPAPDVPAFGNVVPFARRAARDPEPTDARSTILAIERCVPALPDDRGRAWIALLVGASLLIHGGLLAWLSRAPQPLPGIDLPAISVDIVLANSAPAVPPPNPSQPDQETRKQEPDAAPPVAGAVSPAPHESESKPTEQPPLVSRLEPAEPTPAPRQPMEEGRPIQQVPEAAPAAPQKDRPARNPIDEKTSVAPKPKQRAEEKPTRHASLSEPGAQPRPASEARTPVRADPNYLATAAAHMARYKQTPVNPAGNQGRGVAAVNIGIDGAGRVIAVRLVRASGVASWDQEAQAMARRASPFPPPPGGHSMSFTTPVGFTVR